MTTAEVLFEIQQLTTPERLAVVEQTMRMIRDDLSSQDEQADNRNERMRSAAISLKDLYEPGGELAEWSCLDAEEFSDSHVEG